MITPGGFQRGRFTYTAADGSPQEVPIDFNPATLEYTIALNTRGEGGQTQQAAGAASARLALELLFDTTDTGDDVRRKTGQVERLLRPQAPAGGADGPPLAPPFVTFEWGAFAFAGVVDTFRQTIDFFSASGVPLRAVVTLSVSQPNYQFDPGGRGGAAGRGDATFVLPGGNPTALAAAAGDPFGARLIAAGNRLESLRADVRGAVAVGGGVTIGAAAGFAAGAGTGFGVSAGGGPDGAGGPAAFAGLRPPAAGGGGRHLAPERLLAAASAPAIGSGAVFDVTGRAVAQPTSTLQADVTGRGLRFDPS